MRFVCRARVLRRAYRTLVCFALVLSLLPAALAAPEGFTVRHGARDTPRIALTVDDCYDTAYVLSVVELCEEYGVAVTFFPVGSALKYADSSLWQRALDAGCEIGNHTWNHWDLTECEPKMIDFQLLRVQQKLDETLGCHYPMQVMRPPFGQSNLKVSNAAFALGYRHIVKWDIDRTDADKAFSAVQNGSVLLFHARAKDVRCLKTLVPRLIAQGYACVTVSELLGLEAVAVSPDIYRYEKPSD